MDNPPPPSNISTIVKAQIVFLASTLSEDNFERNQAEIRSLSEQHGIDTYLHFIRRLIQACSVRLGFNTPTYDGSTPLTFRLLVQETQRLARDPFLADRFRDGLDKGEGDPFRQFDVARFLDRVGLRPLERLVLASALLAAPLARKELAAQALGVVRAEFENGALALCQQPCFDHADLAPAQVGRLLANLLADLPGDAPILDAGQRQALIMAAQAKLGAEAVASILQRIFPSISLPPGATLVQTLAQLGPEITSDVDTVRALLLRFGISDMTPPADAFVVEMVTSLARYAAEGSQSCDVGALIRALASLNPKLDWPSLIKAFDWQDRHGVDTATLKLIIAILQNCPRDAEPHAVTGFWAAWSNSLYQLRLLDALLSLPGDTFNFITLPGRRIVTVDDVAVASPTIKSLAANVQGHTWNSLDLFEVLVRLAGSDAPEIRNCVKEMLDKAVKISAELVHMGLLQAPQKPWNDIRADYAQRLLNMFLAGHPNHQLVFMRIWQIQPSYLTNAFRDFYHENALNITRILDVAQDLKILDSLLEVRPFTFGLDVAALASRREYLNLDKWLADNVTNHGAEFLHALIEFLEVKMESERMAKMTEVESPTMVLNPQTITVFLRTLRNHSSLMSESDLDYCVEVRSACLQMHPRLMNLIPGSDVEPGLTVVHYPQEIDSEVDNLFTQMYNEQVTVADMLNLMENNRNSSNPRDQEMLACIIHFLFDEYRFYNSYPSRELMMNAFVFGSMIQFQFVEFVPLGISLRYVFDALNMPPDSNMFKWGVQALSRFEARLPEWVPLCQQVLRIPHFVESVPYLAMAMRRIVASADNIPNGTDPRGPGAPTVSEVQEVFTAIRPDRIDSEVQTPSEESSDKILFIVNNLAPNNFDAKVVDMKEHFKDDYSRWFANYLVDQRVSTEPNNHQLYLRFLDALDRKALFKFILHETFVKSAALLSADQTLKSAAERTVLKNMASWLGTLTLARDKPIRHNNLSFKDLLIEASDNNRLPLAIPFVCKTLEPCAKSTVFKEPNPWLMAVIRLLVELYQFAELKLNLKFEIEVLCKALNIDLGKIEPSTQYRNRQSATAAAAAALAEPALPEFIPDLEHLPIGSYDPTGQIHGDGQVLPLGPSSPGGSQRAIGAHIESILSSLAMHVTINRQLAPLSAAPAFKHAVQLGVDRTVREIIVPVVERSVTIAGISTRELATKDFSTDPSEDKLRKAAQLMVQKLAGSLALVTCKDALRSNLGPHIRQALIEQGFSEQSVPEQAILLLVQDNVELACQAIEKAAMDRAVADLEDSMTPSYEARRRWREQRPGQPFWDPVVQQSNYHSFLPDPLRIFGKFSITQRQAVIYEEFGLDTKRRVASRPGSTVSYSRNEHMHGGYSPSPMQEQMVAAAAAPTYQDVMERLNFMTKELEAMLLQIPNLTLATLPSNHDIRHLLRQILSLANEAGERQRTPLAMSQKIAQHLYKTPSQMGREIYVALLDQLCHSFEEVAKEVIPWLVESEDERKYNVPVTVTLLRSGLVTVSQQDQQTANFLFADPKASLQNFAAGLVRECLVADPPVASQTQFANSIGAFVQLSQAGRATEDVDRLLDELRGIRRPPPVPLVEAARPVPVKSEMEQLREKLLVWFQQWVTVYQRSHSPEKSFVPYITQLTKQGILKVEDVSSFFFRVCTEASVGSYLKCATNGDYTYAFQALDAMSRLIVYIIKYHGDASGVDNDQAKVHYLTKILSVVVLVLASMHEEHGLAFPQKPFFRFFSSLINDLHSIEKHLGTAYCKLLLAISDTFGSLQPTYFPGFAFSWMSLVSHRFFMPKLLNSENREGWSAFHKLLLSLFKFLWPFLKSADLQKAALDLYRGSLRILLVLLHDFPEFLSEYYFTLCDAVPSRCIQVRNVILSAFPTGITLPDPHLHTAAFDEIPEMGPIPPILSDFASGLRSAELRSFLDQYLLNRGSLSVLTSLKERLAIPADADGASDAYDVPLMNALVMYIGVSSVAQAKARSGTSLFVAEDSGVVALQYLATNLDAEGQYHLLSAMVMHLRYPNAHTHWFSSMVLHLFTQVKDGRLGEIITRVLLERFIVHRPHPWGALATFIELLRNPKYEFAKQEFAHASREVTILLNNVATAVFQS